MRARVAATLLALATLAAGACELQEVVIAEAEPFVVAEAYLVPDSETRVTLHASAGAAELLDDNAVIRLTSGAVEVLFQRTNPLSCLTPGVALDSTSFPGGLACYVGPDASIVSDGLYRLDVELPDGRVLSGATRVPEQVALGIEADCYLEPFTQLDLAWRSVDGVAAFILDLQIDGLEEALLREGIVVDVPDPFILRGLAIGEADTTIVLPAEFGLFDRFDLDAELALALQQGLPEGVIVNVTIAAADQNYVNWVRGGDFNPSGPIRVPSLFGDGGTGVIASMTVDRFGASTRDENAGMTPCGSATS